MYLLSARIWRAAVASSALGLAAFASSHAAATVVIDTYSDWDGMAYVYEFGCPNTTTYGQVVTIPAGVTSLRKFSFWWTNLTTGSMVVRGYVYAWDNANFVATGPALFRSRRKTIAFNNSDINHFHKVSFHRPISVTPGAQYVIFASIDEDYESCTDGYVLAWADMPDTVYPGGDFVYQNNGGEEANWTDLTKPWNTFGVDIALKVSN